MKRLVPLAVFVFVGVMGGAGFAGPPVTHPISTAPRRGDGPTPRQGAGGFGSYGDEPPLPISKAQEGADGGALYSRDVNRFLCVAGEESGKTWLGTLLGIKCVDKAAGVVRHYGPREGLPGGRVAAIAAEGNEAWCIVERRPGDGPVNASKGVVFHLCAFQPEKNRWTTLRDVAGASPQTPVSYDGNHLTHPARPQARVGKLLVVFTIGGEGAAQEIAAYVWDRRKARLETIPWETGLRADNAALSVWFADFEANEAGLWLGTNAGLLRYDMTGNGAGAWRRELPNQAVTLGAMAKDGSVWAVTTPRSSQAGQQFTPDSWKLYRIKTQGSADVQDRTPPPLKSEFRTPEGATVFLDAERARENVFPLAITAEKDGTLWLTQARSGGSDFTSGPHDAWRRRDAQTGMWTRYAMVAPAQPFSFGQATALQEMTPSGEVRENVSLSVIADAALRPLALHREGFSASDVYYVIDRGGHPVDGGSPEDGRAGFYVRRRFPAWLCAEDAPAETRSPGANVPNGRGGLGPTPDPAGPDGKVWVMDMAGTSLLNLPDAAIPASLREARLRGYFTTPSPEIAETPTIRRYSPPAGQKVFLRPDVGGLVAADQGGDILFMVTQNSSLFSLETRSGIFRRLAVPREGVLLSRYNPPLASEEGYLLLSSPNSSDPSVLRYDVKTDSFRIALTPSFGSRAVGVAPNGGMWLAQNDGRLVFQPPDGADAPPVPLQNTGNAVTFSATGFLGWMRLNDGTLEGYDVERRRATPPLKLTVPDPSSPLRLIADSAGGAFVANGDGVGAAYHYDRERNVWEIAAPPLPALSPLDNSSLHFGPVLAQADEGQLWILADARFLYRYDRRTTTWDKGTPLPEVLRGGSSSYNYLGVVSAENGKAIYIGGQGGLWRFDQHGHSWTELTLPVSVPSAARNNGGNEASMATAMGVGSEAIFTLWRHNSGVNFAARLDRKTAEWTFYEETKGFPERDTGMRLIAAGAGAWLIHGTGTYFFDAGANRWRLMFAPGEVGPSQSGERIPPAALPALRPEKARIADIIADPATGDWLVLTNPEPSAKESVPLLFRFDRNGLLKGRSAAPGSDNPYRAPLGYSLLRDRETVLVASSVGVFRVPAGIEGAIWTRVSAPSGLTASFTPTYLRRAANGRGLYVMNEDYVSYWPDEK